LGSWRRSDVAVFDELEAQHHLHLLDGRAQKLVFGSADSNRIVAGRRRRTSLTSGISILFNFLFKTKNFFLAFEVSDIISILSFNKL
jgi:hypothetical protein